MLKTLGPTAEVVRRREERVLHLRKLDQRLKEVNALIVSEVAKNEVKNDANDLCHVTSNPNGDWSNDKDIWLSGSGLELHLEDKHGLSVIHFYDILSDYTSSLKKLHLIDGGFGL